MLEEILSMADKIMKISSESERHVINQFKKKLLDNNLNMARILSDELVDFSIESNSSKSKISKLEKLYDMTMEYCENVN